MIECGGALDGVYKWYVVESLTAHTMDDLKAMLSNFAKDAL
jgi:hypothetical protein